jgi:hypothetical protein
LIKNIQTHGLFPAEEVVDEESSWRTPENFVRELWEVKDVTGRTSVGKGELAMCVLSTAIKGEPGDVKFKDKDGNEWSTQDHAAANAKVVDVRMNFTDNLAIEVKGSGGRPGKGNLAHKFVANILKNDLVTSGAPVDPNRDKTGEDYEMAYVNQITKHKKSSKSVREALLADLGGKVEKIKDNPEVEKAYSDLLNELEQYLSPELRPGQVPSLYYADAEDRGASAGVELVHNDMTEWVENWNAVNGGLSLSDRGGLTLHLHLLLYPPHPHSRETEPARV